MALEYIATPGALWAGEIIDGVRYPLSIADLWSEAKLADVGLRRYVAPPPADTRDLDTTKAAKIATAWAAHNARFETANVTVTVAGQSRNYGCDKITRENVLAICGAISVAPASVPDPRPFTPKSEAAPVDTSHAEFIAIYLAGIARGDQFYQAYAVHKAAIAALASLAEVDAYDLDAGWPT